MMLRKSPVFHFGIFLVVAVAVLVLAPFVIDWNSYRADLEDYGHKLTGRTVTIEGDVSARLFPWPRLSADDVHVANAPGLTEPDFASARRITIRMTLAGLLQGNLDVESIEVEDPVLNLQRLASGGGNWQFAPAASMIASDVLSRVKLDKIGFTGGTVTFHDGRRGEVLSLSDIRAEAASPGLEGPWRIRGTGAMNGHAVDVAFNTGRYVPGEPFMFGVKLQASDHSGYVVSFDGARDAAGVTGGLRLEPASSDDGKTDAEGRIRPLQFSAQVAGDFDRLSLTKIELSKLTGDVTGPFLTGSADLKLGARIEAALRLDATILDLDELAGAKSRSLLREAGGLAVVDSLLAQLPGDTSLSGTLAVTALKLDGQTFDRVSLDLEADRERLRINRLAADLPGRSAMLFTGSYLAGAGRGELAGDLAFETSDLRDFSMWLWPDGRAKLEDRWKGSRGRFKMQAGLNMTAAGFRLSPAAFELDGAAGTGAIAMNSAGRGAVDIEIDSRRLDLDSYAPQGIPAMAVAAQEGVEALLRVVLPREGTPDLRVQMKAGELQLNGVLARDVAIDLQSSATGLDLRALRIGAVGGASVEAAGLVLDTGSGADGALSLNVAAQDPRELLKLLGFGGRDHLPVWAQSLGPTSLRGDLAVSPGSAGAELVLKLRGKAGDIDVSGDARAVFGGKLIGALSLEAPDSRPILALLGLGTGGEAGDAGSLTIKGEGNPAGELDAAVALQVLGARLDYSGHMNLQAAGYGLDGQVRIGTTDVAPLLRSAGFPVSVPPGSALVAEAPVKWADGQWDFNALSGRLGLEQFSGAISLSPTPVIEGRLKTGSIALRDLLALAFLDWSGPAAGLETGFARAWPLGLEGELWLTPESLTVYPGLVIEGPEIGLEASAGAIHAVMHAKDVAAGDAAFELRSTGSDASRSLSGSAVLPLDLATPVALADGSAVMQGRGRIELSFSSEGRSPAAALAGVKGDGRYDFGDLLLLEVSLADFASALARAGDAAGVSAALTSLKSGEGLRLEGMAGQISVLNGEMSFSPLDYSDAAADVTVKALADLVQGAIDVEVTLVPKARAGLPAMSIAYAGPPGALERLQDSSALETALGVTIMQEGLVELERLQKEQARLAKLEEEQRREDELRLQAYYAQRDELLLRRRELRVHGELRAMEADRLRRQIEAERAINSAINKAEMRQRLREIKTWRRIAQAAAAPPAPTNRPASKPARPPDKPAPVVLEKPPGAPVQISPEPGSAPSQ